MIRYSREMTCGTPPVAAVPGSVFIPHPSSLIPLRKLAENPDCQPAIRAIQITAAVASLVLVLKIVDPVDIGQLTGLAQVVHELIALGIDIGTNVMRDLTRGVTEPHLGIKGRGSDPEGPAVF